MTCGEIQACAVFNFEAWTADHLTILSIDFISFFQGAFKTMTVDEYFAKNPQSKEKIDDEIRNQNWGY